VSVIIRPLFVEILMPGNLSWTWKIRTHSMYLVIVYFITDKWHRPGDVIVE